LRGKNRSTRGSNRNRCRSTNGCKHGLTNGEGRRLSRGTSSKLNNWSRDTHRSSRSCKIDNSKGTGIPGGEKNRDDFSFIKEWHWPSTLNPDSLPPSHT